MTLEELQNETLVEKHRRLMQEKCRHDDEIWRTTVSGPIGTFTQAFCLDCGKYWSSAIKAKAGEAA